MTEHLPILQVILPLMAAPACIIVNRHREAWAFSLLVSLAALGISILLLREVLASGTISYALGGWDAPWGIEYRIDLLNAFVLLVICIFNLVALVPAYQSVEKEISGNNKVYFYTLYLLCFAGLLGITATGDAFNIFVFLEISSLSTYALVALGRHRRALWAAYRYLVVGTIGASFILIGIGFLYVSTGTLNIHDLSERIPPINDSLTVLAALVFMVTGVCIKLALFPLHAWLPDSYTYAPSIVTVFLAATATKVGVYLLIRFIYTLFGHEFSFMRLPLQEIFLTLGILAVFFASMLAITQTNIKKMFAYSSVAQIGYMVVGLGIGTAIGLQASLLHLFNHAFMKGALFLAIAAVMYQMGGTQVEDFRGLGKRMPWTMLAIVIGCLSLIGVPLTAGFVSKWYLVLAALNAELWLVAILVVVGSLLTVIYCWRLIENAYFQPAEETAVRCEASPVFLIAIWVLVLANIYFGIDTRLNVGITEQIANALTAAGRGM